MSATDVLYRAHLKLQSRRKLSPTKLLEKQQEKQVNQEFNFQKKASEFRAQIESSRKHLFDKIRERQNIIKDRWKEMLAEKKAKLYDKLGQAEERRGSEIQTLKDKAKQELLKIDETNYIMKLTMSNLKLDLDQKMSETLERRQQLLEEYKQRKHQGMQLKMEAAEKRRQVLLKVSENKFQSNQQKREQANQRRKKMLKEKKRIAEEMAKRADILKRKSELGDKISDIMSFISNSENIWEFLANDLDWSDFYLNGGERVIFDLLSKDSFEIEKIKLKKDAEILNQLIIVTEEGEIFARKELIATAIKKIQRHNASDDSSLGGDDVAEEEKELKVEFQNSSPAKFGQDINGGYLSDSSDKGSASEDNFKSSILSNNLDSQLQSIGLLTDEDANFQLYSIRVKMSMKRNILKKNLSEDLTWADFLKNDYYYKNVASQNPFNLQHNRSLHSTPERRHDIPSESDKDSSANENSVPVLTQATNHSVSKKRSKREISKTNSQTSFNQHEKQSISQQVYPSRKKKNPNNKNNNQNQSIQNDLRSSGSQNSMKKFASSSNQNSAQSLAINPANQSSQSSFIHQDLSKDSLQLQRKSTMVESTGDSGRKKQNNWQHSSTQMDSFQINQSSVDESHQEKGSEMQQVSAHTGTQMTQLITNNKPNPPSTKIVPKKLSTNAVRLLFPIREQKLLFKRPGKEGQFGKCRISIKLEDLLQQRSSLLSSQPLASSQQTPNMDSIDANKPEQTQTTSSRKSLQSTPSFSNRRQSIDTNTSQPNSTNQQHSSIVQQMQLASQAQQEQVPSAFTLSTPTQSARMAASHQKLQAILNFESKIPKITGSKMGSNLPSENSPSPRKDLAQEIIFKSIADENITLPSSNETQILMNEQGYKEAIIKIIMSDNVPLIKNEDNQKTLVLEGAEGDKIIDYLEAHEFQIRYCRLCDLVIPDHLNNEAHINLKSHKRTREDLGIKDTEDAQYAIFSLVSTPGEIEKELIREKEKALKRKVKRIKAQMVATAESHEQAAYCPGKDITSANKKGFQIMCINLEKQVIPIIKDYEVLENILKEIIKLLDTRKQADLHLMRKLKFMPILIEICKRISVCHKNEFKHLGRVLEHVIKIISLFCGLKENRNYMLQTNRLASLIELLNWCLNRPTQLYYGISFLPQLFHILTAHIKHRAPYECQSMKELYIEYIVCSQITMKIKAKLQIINGPMDLSEMMGQVPLLLIKSASFLEALTSVISIDARIRPVYDKSTKIGEQVFFVLQNNELFGIIPMITTILLSRNQPFKPSTQSQPIQITKVLPQTILSLAIISIKIINNIFRMDHRFGQQMVGDQEIQEQLYHLFNYLLVYGAETSDKQEDSRELLHETLLMIGYFALFNEKNQQLLCKGENTILQKLCGLPFPYFCDKKLKEILFPTLISVSYKNERSLAIMDQEISIDLIVDFLQDNLKDELPKIIEEDNDYQSMSSLGGGMQLQGNNGERRTNRSPSLSSTKSSNCSLQLDLVKGNSPFLPMDMRFAKKQWKDALTFYQKALY